MLVRPIAFAALAGIMFIGGTMRAPSTTKYRIDLKVVTVADLTQMGGAQQTQNNGITGFLTVTLDDTTGGRTLLAVIDSVLADSGTGIPAATLDSARGATYTGLVGPDGKVSNLQAGSENAAAAQFQGILSDFFPLMRQGA
ncbi:MAG: hypothetical protein ACREL6_01245, partial [Gemmatimonadales bacterium]